MPASHAGHMTQNQPPYGSQGPGTGPKQLRRSQTDRKISGVCGGIAEYLDVDANLVRILVVIGTIVTGGGLALAYLVALVIMPDGSAPPMWKSGYQPPAGTPAPPYAQGPQQPSGVWAQASQEPPQPGAQVTPQPPAEPRDGDGNRPAA
jgi:phage shock protein C